MEWLWTWSGKSFGYRRDDELRTRDGRHVGRFIDDEIYAPDGRYLGELRSGRLIRKKSKSNYKISAYKPRANLVGRVGRVNYVGRVMIVGYEDFPAAEAL